MHSSDALPERYLGATLPVDPGAIYDLAKLAGIYVGARIIDKATDGALDQAFEVLTGWLRSKAHLKTAQERGLVIWPISSSGPGDVLIDLGHLRPMISVGRGRIVMLSNITYLYDGDPTGILHADEPPGFILNGIEFVKKGSSRATELLNKRPTVYQAKTTLWVDEKHTGPVNGPPPGKAAFMTEARIGGEPKKSK
jgi:hypothetical protein